MTVGTEIKVRVVAIEEVADSIKRFRFERPDGQSLPTFSAGSHIVVSMQGDTRRIRNPYSLMGSLNDPNGYEISVLRTPESRGGSHFMHDRVKVGDTLVVSAPINLFPIDTRAKKHILLAGGIGITPFIAMVERLTLLHATFELHYAMRSPERGAYVERLSMSNATGRTQIYYDSLNHRIDLDGLLGNQPLGTHLYVCGPGGMIEGVLNTARKAGWPTQNLHSERFLAPPPGIPFLARLKRSNKTVEVSEHQSLLEAVEAAGVEAPFLCRGGACGQCETKVLSHDGTLVHNDHYLTEDERAGDDKLMICVSRFKGRELVLDL